MHHAGNQNGNLPIRGQRSELVYCAAKHGVCDTVYHLHAGSVMTIFTYIAEDGGSNEYNY